MSKAYKLYWLSGLLLFAYTVSSTAFTLSSPAFTNNCILPQRYTCDGLNIAPPLSWDTPPANTSSLVLIVSDPDAPNGIWYHWLLLNLPAQLRALPTRHNKLPLGTTILANSWHHYSYDGPCPPLNSKHRYLFQLYALDNSIASPDQLSSAQIFKAMQGHILGSTQLLAYYQRLTAGS